MLSRKVAHLLDVATWHGFVAQKGEETRSLPWHGRIRLRMLYLTKSTISYIYYIQYICIYIYAFIIIIYKDKHTIIYYYNPAIGTDIKYSISPDRPPGGHCFLYHWPCVHSPKTTRNGGSFSQVWMKTKHIRNHQLDYMPRFLGDTPLVACWLYYLTHCHGVLYHLAAYSILLHFSELGALQQSWESQFPQNQWVRGGGVVIRWFHLCNLIFV